MKEFISIIKKNKLTISSCESFTGGMFSSLVTNYKNSSTFFKGGFCCYSDEYKIEVLKINSWIIKKHSAVSKETLEGMLTNTQNILKSDIVFGFTGYAPPSSVDDELKGLSYIGFRLYNKNYIYKFINNNKISRKKYKILAIKEIINNFLNIFKNS
ncbi:competence damage-inducible protein A [Spiroplasma litorale]|uniref:Competence damage-inducible protein A n=1 Tax=Spiroplasma litorale TaxID=216942 RepID=A0A0K1W273_9MOLU|nr:CinA family protein [Spiroplasma litorale]AKX34429.1 competence damage-inducible protein A [Spiroplasma litorale]